LDAPDFLAAPAVQSYSGAYDEVRDVFEMQYRLEGEASQVADMCAAIQATPLVRKWSLSCPLRQQWGGA
jgi:hypothetical protein